MEKEELNLVLKPIGYAETCFKEKFGIPRQPGLCPHSLGKVILSAPYNRKEAIIGLETFSHIVIYFHAHKSDGEKLSIRPPRLGGNKKVGVFAAKSPNHPNGFCHSVVKLDLIDFNEGVIYFSNHDILDGSPIIDIKPYIPRWDSYPNASEGWLADANEIKNFQVKIEADFPLKTNQEKLIREVLSMDPRPAYKASSEEKNNEQIVYGFKILDFEVKFKIMGNEIVVTHIEA